MYCWNWYLAFCQWTVDFAQKSQGHEVVTLCSELDLKPTNLWIQTAIMLGINYQKPYAEYTHMCFTMRIFDCKTRRLYNDSKVWPWGWNQLGLHSYHADEEYEIKLLLDWMTRMFRITGYEALCVSGSVPGCHHLEPLFESSLMV